MQECKSTNTTCTNHYEARKTASLRTKDLFGGNFSQTDTRAVTHYITALDSATEPGLRARLIFFTERWKHHRWQKNTSLYATAT